MKRRLLRSGLALGVGAALVFGSALPRADASPGSDLKAGVRSYEEGDFEAAQEAFSKAAEAAAKGESDRRDPAVARYNLGNSLFRRGKFEEASAAFVESLNTGDLALQARAYFNRGNTLVSQSVQSEQEQQLPASVGQMKEAANMYEQSMRLNPADLDPKINYELALKRIEELEIKQQEQSSGESESQEDQESQDSESQQDPQPPQDPQSQEPQQDQQQQSSESQESEQESEQNSSQSQQEQQEQTSGDSSSTPRESQPMTKEEAEMLLNAMREEETSSRQQLRLQYGELEGVEKDW